MQHNLKSSQGCG